MSGLLGPSGEPMGQYLDRKTPTFSNKKAAPPKLGESFGRWAGNDVQFSSLPGGGIVQFDLSKLTLEDFRGMRDHYQVNASLAVLSFMQHQSDWHIECDDKRIEVFVEEQLRNNWTQLNRSLSTANWAGYSPAALEYDNNFQTGAVDLTKIKDLIPEDCVVKWKMVDGWAPPGRTPPKFHVYDGIKQMGSPYPIPVENSLWYPLLMENGDYYGRKLLKPAFQSWFFSILLHLFANRYYERFGEPTPIGRAPYDEDITIGGSTMHGSDFLLNVLQRLRSRSAVVLPNDRSQDSSTGRLSYDYEIEYLESQMRGADFERYMTRLDEEISIGLFTPILLLRTADVGSYNLGIGHMQMYLWMLNAMNDDRKQYIDKYLLSKVVDYNFSPKAPRAKIVFRKMGNTDSAMLKDMILALLNKDKIKIDVRELGEMAGMSISEIQQTTAPAPAPVPDPGTGTGANGTNPATPAGAAAHIVVATGKEIVARVRGQVEAAFRDERFGPDMNLNLGYKNKLEKVLLAAGLAFPGAVTDAFYSRMDAWVTDTLPLGTDGFSSADSFMGLFERVLENEIKELAAS